MTTPSEGEAMLAQRAAYEEPKPICRYCGASVADPCTAQKSKTCELPAFALPRYPKRGEEMNTEVYNYVDGCDCSRCLHEFARMDSNENGFRSPLYGWESWFAWYPVEADAKTLHPKWIWLRACWRVRTNYYGKDCGWQYTRFGENLHD